MFTPPQSPDKISPPRVAGCECECHLTGDSSRGFCVACPCNALLTPGEAAELQAELDLHGRILAAQRALHEIAENTTRASYQHRARALLALQEIED